jgi:hypothetical protein
MVVAMKVAQAFLFLWIVYLYIYLFLATHYLQPGVHVTRFPSNSHHQSFDHALSSSSSSAAGYLGNLFKC